MFVCLTWLSQYQKSERMAARHQLPIDNMVDDLGDAHSKVNYRVVYRKLMTLVTHTWMRMSRSADSKGQVLLVVVLISVPNKKILF